MRLICFIGILILLTACSAKQITIVHGKNTDTVNSSIFERQIKPRQERENPRNFPLLISARSHLSQGDYDKASSLVDRAIRLQPQNPWVWYEMARIHFYQQKNTEAKQFLGRARHLVSTDRELDRLVSELDQRLN